MNVIVSKLQYPEVWEGIAKFETQLETAQMPAAKKGIGMLKHDEQYSMESRTVNVPT